RIEPPRLLAVHVFIWIEALQLASKLGVEGFRIEVGDAGGTALAAKHGFPESIDGKTDRRERTHARHDYPALCIWHIILWKNTPRRGKAYCHKAYGGLPPGHKKPGDHLISDRQAPGVTPRRFFQSDS